MGELADAAEGTFEDRAGTPPLDIGNNAHAASVVLMGRVVEALSLGHCVVKGEPRHRMVRILHEGLGARVGILLRGRGFR